MTDTLFVDYSFARPTPATLKAAGYTGAVRYLSSGTGPVNPKDLTVPEARALLAAGLRVLLVWETTANRAGAGQAAGAADAHAAEAQADALGYPINAVIFYAVDFDATPAKVVPYFAGVRGASRRPVGVYGSLRVVEGVTVPYKWQTSAWSGGKVSARAHLYQRQTRTGPRASVGGTDENVLIMPVPSWGSPVAPLPGPASDVPPVFTPTPPAPTPKGTDMPLTDDEIHRIAADVWNRFLIHGPNGDVTLAVALAQLLAAAAVVK